MKNEILIRIYTQPLFALAVEARQIEEIGAEVQILATLFQAVPALREYLSSTSVSRSAKLDLLRKCYDRPWSKYFANFVALVLRKGRQEILPDAWHAYRQFWDEHNQKLHVTVTTAVELSENQRRILTDKLAKRTGKKISLKSQLDPQALGGIRVQIGHQLWDATVTNMLANMKQTLLQK